MRVPVSLLLLLLCACAEPTAEPAPVVIAEESRYRVIAEATPIEPGVGMLDLRVEATGGWHIAPEAPVRLDIEAFEVTFSPAKLRAEHARTLDEDAIEWSCEFRADKVSGSTATAQLKFGICEGPAEKCVIIRREVEIPIGVALAK